MKIRRTIFQLLHWFEKKYYKLGFFPRHILGFTIVVFILSSVIGIGYGGYRGAKGAWHLGKDLYHSCIEFFTEDKSPDYSSSAWKHFDFPVPDGKKHPKRVPNYGKDFADVNDVQLKAAKKLGIKPLKSREDLEQIKGKLVQLRDTRYYSVLPLTSSSPYLVPRAADFLTALGRLMQEYNGTDSRFYVSSVLRTRADVKSLQRSNGNATENSTHCYGTTVDITYSKFDIHGKTTEGKVKEDLARALYDLQQMGYCYVIYERKQPCFHVTVRP